MPEFMRMLAEEAANNGSAEAELLSAAPRR
jgi:hypothetical protein